LRPDPAADRPHTGGRTEGDYDRTTVYCPQAVKWIVTVVETPPLVTTAASVPESNRGSTLQLVL